MFQSSGQRHVPSRGHRRVGYTKDPNNPGYFLFPVDCIKEIKAIKELEPEKPQDVVVLPKTTN